MENNKITAAEALEQIDRNFETIDTNKGKIRVSKIWMGVCAGIGAATTVVGGVCMGVLGFTLIPVATTGLGIATAVASGTFLNGLSKDSKRADIQETRMYDLKDEIETREAKREAKKVKTK